MKKHFPTRRVVQSKELGKVSYYTHRELGLSLSFLCRFKLIDSITNRSITRLSGWFNGR